MWPNLLVTFTEKIYNGKLYVFHELDQQPYFFNFGWRIFEKNIELFQKEQTCRRANILFEDFILSRKSSS